MTQNGNEKETDIFTKIINKFLDEGVASDFKDELKHRSIIELMKGLKDNKDKELAKNALILLLNLYDDYPPDLFSSLGTDIEKLSDGERDSAMFKLKEIFLKEGEED